IGRYSTAPYFRGRKLVLEYTHGDRCPGSDYYRSSLFSFICDRDIMQQAAISFIGEQYDCFYAFEVRTAHACAATNAQETLSPWTIFGLIFLIMFLVYCFASTFYRR
ncbi:hypothetical protein CANCADRAFT_17838, partial [Tortispora caseinolytica NRRL Y-17796]